MGIFKNSFLSDTRYNFNLKNKEKIKKSKQGNAKYEINTNTFILFFLN